MLSLSVQLGWFTVVAPSGFQFSTTWRNKKTNYVYFGTIVTWREGKEFADLIKEQLKMTSWSEYKIHGLTEQVCMSQVLKIIHLFIHLIRTCWIPTVGLELATSLFDSIEAHRENYTIHPVVVRSRTWCSANLSLISEWLEFSIPDSRSKI